MNFLVLGFCDAAKWAQGANGDYARHTHTTVYKRFIQIYNFELDLKGQFCVFVIIKSYFKKFKFFFCAGGNS